MREQRGSKALTAHGTLYKALGRLEDLGLLTSAWEDAAEAEGRTELIDEKVAEATAALGRLLR